MDQNSPAPTLESLGLRVGVAIAESGHNAIQKVRYSHDAMIDRIVANPWVMQKELAAVFGYTEGWVSQVIASDAFQSRLAERKEEIVDPVMRATLEEQFKGLVARSLEILRQKLDRPASQVPDKLALRAVELGAKALGMGVAPPPPPPATGEAHLELLAQRLDKLLTVRRAPQIIDVTPE